MPNGSHYRCDDKRSEDITIPGKTSGIFARVICKLVGHRVDYLDDWIACNRCNKYIVNVNPLPPLLDESDLEQ